MTVCELCGVDSSSLDQHKRDVHLNNVLCECCDKIFSRPYHLKDHLKNKGKKVNDCDNDPCEHCGKKFKTKKSLKCMSEMSIQKILNAICVR